MFQFQFKTALLLSVAALLATGTTIATTTTAGVTLDDSVSLLVSSNRLETVSLNTLSVTETSSRYALGVTFDTQRRKAVWTEYAFDESSIRRAYPDGTELEVLAPGYVYALAIDAYTGNMYYGEAQGEFGDRIVLCNGEVQNCVTIASSPTVVSYPIGIAVHVQRSKIYWTNTGTLSNIVKANLDGSDATAIVAGLVNPCAVVVDNDNRRIYWTDRGDNTIGSSDLEGGDMRLLVASFRDRLPYGLVMNGNLLYIGNSRSNNVLSVDKNSGGDLRVVYSAPGAITHMALIDSTASLSAADQNPCEGNRCSHLCVPIIDSYRCLCPENLVLGGNQRTCLSLE